MAAGKVTIIDYGIGNLRSIEKAFESVGSEVIRTDSPALLAEAERAVLPGVGAFGACAAEIERRGLIEPIHAYVASGRPFLGVCVGMQLLFEGSVEHGAHPGLGLLPGHVRRFSFSNGEHGIAGGDTPLKIPHMGWNSVIRERDHRLFDDVEQEPFFYFVHSYHADAERPADVLGSTSYGYRFPAIVGNENVYGVQFHPEKSQRSGLQILLNFSNLTA